MIKKTISIASILSIALVANFAAADNSWNGYHWARTSNPFILMLGDNVSSSWDPIMATTASDWSKSSVLDTTIVPGQSRANCRATLGRVEVCNKTYGNNGWLGIAQIWVSGLHITQGTVKVNDTYFLTPTYNTTAWRNLVMCQEVGHTLGLDHQDTDFNNPNLGTCMDYTNDPSTNQHPNQHDYHELALIYAHLDTTTTVGSSTVSKGNSGADLEDPSSWGQEVRRDAKNHSSVFERDLGGGHKIFTFVIWTE